MCTPNRYLMLFLFSAFTLFSLRSGAQNQKLTEQQKIARDRMDSVHQIALQTEKTYHEMDNASLLKKLLEQSKEKKEPFNSTAYRELLTRKEVDPNALSGLVRDYPNSDGLLPLLLLRKINNTAYIKLAVPLRVSVLTSALAESKYYNSWGIPPFYLQDASLAMLECDTAAYARLRKLLGDQRPAPVFGSKEYMIYQRYQYRVCDYALFFLHTLRRDGKLVMPVRAEGRDSLIRAIVR